MVLLAVSLATQAVAAPMRPSRSPVGAGNGSGIGPVPAQRLRRSLSAATTSLTRDWTDAGFNLTRIAAAFNAARPFVLAGLVDGNDMARRVVALECQLPVPSSAVSPFTEAPDGSPAPQGENSTRHCNSTEGQADATAILAGQLVASPTIEEMIARFDRETGAAKIDIDRVREKHASPLDILRATCFRHGRAISPLVDARYRRPPDPGDEALDLLDEAASVDYRSYPSVYPHDAQSFGEVREVFVERLGRWLDDLHIGTWLIPESANGAPLWFDRIALRGALGETVASLAAAFCDDTQRMQALRDHGAREGIALHLSSPPDTDHCRTRIADLMRARLTELGESTRFPFGTPIQSMATTILRLGAMHGLNAPEIRNTADVLRQFAALEAAWQTNATYPIDPRYVAAAHLGISSASDTGMAAPASTTPAPTPNATLPSGTATTLASGPPSRFAEAVDAGRFAERLLAYQALPVWRRSAAVEHILIERLGFSRAQLSDTLYGDHTFESARRFRRVIRLPGTPAAHFDLAVQHREVMPRLYTSQGTPAVTAGVTDVRPADELLDKAERGFTRKLNGVARAKAREMLLLRQLPDSDDAVNALASAILRRRATYPRDSIAERIRGAIEIIDPLTISQPVRHVVDAIAEGDVQSLMEMLPFVVPAYDVEEGLRTRDFARAKNGALRFSIDAVLVWAGGMAERAAARSMRIALEEMRMAPIERRNAVMLHTLAGESPNIADDTVAETAFNTFDVQGTLTTLPADRLSVDPYELLETEASRTPRVQAQDPGEGTSSTLRSYSLTGHGPSLRPNSVLFDEASTSIDRASEMSAPPDSTLQSVTRYLQEHRRNAVSDTITKLADRLQCCEPKSHQPPRLDEWLHASTPEGQAAIDRLQSMVNDSPTLAILTRDAGAAAIRAQRPWNIVITHEGLPKVWPDLRQIRLLADNVPIDAHYETVSGQHTFTHESAALHEFLHAVLELPDASSPGHRGAVVYFTDLIAYELNWLIGERVMYRDGGATATANRLRHAAKLRMHREDAALDQQVKRALRPPRPSHILGTPAQERVAIRDGTALRNVMRYVFPTDTDFTNVRTLEFEIDSVSRRSNVRSLLRGVLRKLERSSAVMGALYQLWKESNADSRWVIRVIGSSAMPPGSFGMRGKPWHIDYPTHVISMHFEPVRYLSASGPRVMTTEHRMVGMLTEFFADAVLYQRVGDPYTERDLLVLIENEARRPAPDNARVAVALDPDPDVLWPYTTRARRAAEDEDRYLKSLA
ncbi:hypothetical protein GCM10027419_43210 [Pandoraea terrae]